MLSLNLLAPFSPSASLVSVENYDSARKASPFCFCFDKFHSVSPALLLCLGAVCVGLSRRKVFGGTLLCKLHPGFSWLGKFDEHQRMLDLLAVECPHRSLGRRVPACVKWAPVRPWLREYSLYAGNFTNYHYATDLPISEEVTKDVVVWQLWLHLASSGFLDLSGWF